MRWLAQEQNFREVDDQLQQAQMLLEAGTPLELRCDFAAVLSVLFSIIAVVGTKFKGNGHISFQLGAGADPTREGISPLASFTGQGGAGCSMCTCCCSCALVIFLVRSI